MAGYPQEEQTQAAEAAEQNPALGGGRGCSALCLAPLTTQPLGLPKLRPEPSL